MDTTKKSPIVISLCTGIRGIERGIERAIGQPIRVAAFSEIEAFIIENLLAGMEAGVLDPAPIWSNIKTFPWETFSGKVHGIIGGYPCQPFSVAGNRGGEDDPRHLWPYIAYGIRTVQPLWCFFENVGGHLTLGYETVRGELQDMGYHVEEGIFSAEEVGAPHRRERMFILAVLANSGYNDGRLSESTEWVKNIETTRSGEVLGHSNSNGYTQGYGFGTAPENTSGNKIEDRKRERIWAEFTPTGEEMANATSQRLSFPRSTREWKFSEESRKGFYDRFEQSGINLAHASMSGLEGFWSNARQSRQSQSWDCRFPARPGEQQYDWEDPRTIKSGMGITINGYNFREDLLRAAGNGVVEQTAELAWNTLWDKHFKK